MAKLKEDVRTSIMAKMKSEGRSLKWLSEKTEINYNTIHSCLVRKLFSVSQDNLDKINKALEADFLLPSE